MEVHLQGYDADDNLDIDIDNVDVAYVPGEAEYDFGVLPKTNQYDVSVVLFDNVDGSGEYGYASTPAFPLTPSDITLWSTGQNVTINWFQPQDYVDTSFAVTLDGGSYHETVETDDADWSGSEYGWADFTGVPVGTYTATVTATNVSGEGPTATQTLLVVDGHDVPSAARSVTATNSSPHKVTRHLGCSRQRRRRARVQTTSCRSTTSGTPATHTVSGTDTLGHHPGRHQAGHLASQGLGRELQGLRRRAPVQTTVTVADGSRPRSSRLRSSSHRRSSSRLRSSSSPSRPR